VFSIDDTIVAVATAAGHAGIGVVRISGPEACAIGERMAQRARPFVARRATRASIETSIGPTDAIVTRFVGPASYTGEDVLEISAHGNPVLLAAVVDAAVALGARPAARGEFTLRAFVRGKIDLVQAEGVRDLVDALSPAQLRAATRELEGTLSHAIGAIAQDLRSLETRLEASLDFPDEGYRFITAHEVAAALSAVRDRVSSLLAHDGRADVIRDGARVVIAGAPNVGKSSVFNAIVGRDRAIVTPIAGTTRDLVTERVVIGGELALLVDTAGLRRSADVVEVEGVRRASSAIDEADVVVAVLDRSQPVSEDERAFVDGLAQKRSSIVVANKVDLPGAWECGSSASWPACEVSARTGYGVAELQRRIGETIRGASAPPEATVVTNVRHRALLADARTHLDRACAALAEARDAVPEELVIADVRLTLDALEAVTGRRTADEVLADIFQTFCIGK
jgi:tRNA modification GTPase